jgi:hypothetical protein
MDLFKGHVFRSQPPVIRLGGYQPPSFKIKSKQSQPNISVSDDTFIADIKLLKTEFQHKATHLLAILPENLGRSQGFSNLWKDLQALKNELPQKELCDTVYWSELELNTLARPTSAKILPTPYRPISASTGVFTTRTRMSRNASTRPISANAKTRLLWSPSQARLKLEVPGEGSAIYTSLSSQAVEEKLYEEGPDKLKIKAYKGEYKYGVRDGNGSIQYENGDTYTGEWSQNVRNGQGTYHYIKLGITYAGLWDKGLKSGQGSMKLVGGHVIHGYWVNDQLQDTQVSITYAEGGEYNGAIRQGKRHGKGNMTYKCGCVYDGDWVDDMRNGIGLISFVDKSFFEGEFDHDYTSGRGVLVLRNKLPEPPLKVYPKLTPKQPTEQTTKKYSNFSHKKKPKPPPPPPDYEAIERKALTHAKSSLFGRSTGFPRFDGYELNGVDIIWKSIEAGQFTSGKLNGRGIVRYGAYGVYEGEFKNGMRNGVGKMIYIDPGHAITWFPETEGEYSGEWKDDMRHGKGIMVWVTGLKYSGHFKKDRRSGVVGTMYFLSGDIYEGEWQDELMHGKGKYRTPDRKIYRGKFLNGDFGGEGVLVFPSGEKYEGEVKKMIPCGKGKMYYNNGNRYFGYLEKGIREGQGVMEYKNGDRYSGEWASDLREGYGEMLYACTGEIYKGWWGADQREGFGELLNRKKEAVFRGNWKMDKKDGDATLILTGL